MSEPQDFVDTYNAGLREERELWAEMKGRYPGQPGFNKPLWDRWLAAIMRCTSASRAMRQAGGGTNERGASK